MPAPEKQTEAVTGEYPQAAGIWPKNDWMPEVMARLRRIESEPLPKNIFALLEDRAREIPNEIALHMIATDEKLTYRQLHDHVLRFAAGFHRIGIARGRHIAVMLSNVREMPLTWLALARIGAVIVPVNVRYTGHELHYLLKDSEATHLIIEHEYLNVLPAMPEPLPADRQNIVVACGPCGPYRAWDDLLLDSGAEAANLPQPAFDDLMNIQYTSGTTGLPKGCLLTQQYWLTCAKAQSDCDGVSYKQILAANPYFYMTPQWLLLMAFFQRGTLHLATHRSLTNYLDWIRDNKIEFCLIPFDVLTQRPPEPNDNLNEMKRGSIYIHQKERHAEMERRFDFPVRTAFGMTEIGAGMFTPLEATEMTGSGSCGIASPFRELRIADNAGNALKPGQPGELQVRGPGLLKGYYHKPEATRDAFHGDWFRTGDLAFLDARGFCYIVGRIKEMIRRSGENISATEVENALLALPDVLEAGAIPVPDEKRGEEVKACIVLKPGKTSKDLPPQQIIAHCRERLAVFKIPRYIEYRTEPLPRSTSGKVKKPALVAEKPDLRVGSWDRVSDSWL